MESKGNIFVLIVIILVVLAIALGGTGVYLLQRERLKSSELQLQLDQVNAEYGALKAQLDTYKKKAMGLEEQVKQSQSIIDDLTHSIAQEKAAREEAAAKLNVLKQELEGQKALRMELESKAAQAVVELETTRGLLKDLEAQKQELESKVKELQANTQNLELGKIVVGSTELKKDQAAKAAGAVEPAAPAQTKAGGLEGKVLVVNRDHDFIVINMGSKDGVKLGDKFYVYQADNLLGEVKIEKLHDSMAAAGFLEPGMKEKVNEGNRVSQSAK